jgi:hypothetical protein
VVQHAIAEHSVERFVLEGERLGIAAFHLDFQA